MTEARACSASRSRTPPAERAAYLDQDVSGDDAPAPPRRDSARAPTIRPAASWRRPQPAVRRRPSISLRPRAPAHMIGPYKLLEQIGEGGMGTVWMAEQTEPVKRRVALKLIKAGMDSPAGAGPVRGGAAGAGADGPPEHRQGARRRHAPTRGRPYFVMELVKGVPDHQVLRRATSCTPRRAAGAVRAGLPGDPARAPEGDHPPRHQAVERPGRAVRRQAGAEGDRLRRRQGDRAAADRARRWSPASARSSARRSTCRPSRRSSTSSTSTRAATSTRSGVLLYELLTGTHAARAQAG